MENFAPYTVVGEPFVGGFARVYKAIRLDMPGQYFAIKTPKDPNSTSDIKQFLHEAKMLKRVQHQNIIKCFEARLESQPPFLVLEYMAGGNLKSLIGKTDFNTILLILYQVSDALNAIHSAGGFHRDIKPENILVSAEGQLILSDLNLANVPSPSSQITRHVCGTPGYIDPFIMNEQYDCAADICSLGITMFELITGNKPKMIEDQYDLSPLEDKFPSASEEHKKAFVKLVQSMLLSKRSLRPAIHTIKEYVSVIIHGGQLPQLPAKPKTSKSSQQPPSIGEAIAIGTFAGLLLVGIVALIDSFDKE